MAGRKSTEENNSKKKEDKVYKQRSYYLPDELIRAITIKTAESELDKSEVVREALELYLADILEYMRERKKQKREKNNE